MHIIKPPAVVSYRKKKKHIIEAKLLRQSVIAPFTALELRGYTHSTCTLYIETLR